MDKSNHHPRSLLGKVLRGNPELQLAPSASKSPSRAFLTGEDVLQGSPRVRRSETFRPPSPKKKKKNPLPRSSALTLQRSSRPELTLSALDTCSRSASGSSRYEAIRLGPAAPPPAGGEAGEQGEPGALRQSGGPQSARRGYLAAGVSSAGPSWRGWSRLAGALRQRAAGRRDAGRLMEGNGSGRGAKGGRYALGASLRSPRRNLGPCPPSAADSALK